MLPGLVMLPAKTVRSSRSNCNYQMNQKYPNITQCFGLFGLAIGCQVISGVVTSGLPAGWLLFCSQLISNLLILAIALNFRYKTVDFRYLLAGHRKINLLVLPAVIFFTIGYILFMDPIVSLIPMPESIQQLFKASIHKDVTTYLGLAIIAPLGEEFLFRRLMLPGLVRNYGMQKGIIWSAFFFSLFHLNPWQGISAFFIGVFLAWIYLKTSNIWVPIVVHWFNNSASFAFFYYMDDPFAATPNFLGAYQWLILMVISAVCMYLCLRILQRQFIPMEPCNEDQEETGPPRPSEA